MHLRCKFSVNRNADNYRNPFLRSRFAVLSCPFLCHVCPPICLLVFISVRCSGKATGTTHVESLSKTSASPTIVRRRDSERERSNNTCILPRLLFRYINIFLDLRPARIAQLINGREKRKGNNGDKWICNYTNFSEKNNINLQTWSRSTDTRSLMNELQWKFRGTLTWATQRVVYCINHRPTSRLT